MHRLIAAIVVTFLLLSATVRAAEPPLFTERPLDAAIGDSTARHRLLLVVVTSNPSAQKAVDAVWSNPALRAWARRHAIVVNLNDRDKIRSMTTAGLVMPSNGEPLVFRDGKMIRLFGSKPNAKGVPVPSNKEIKADLSLLLRLQWTLEAQRAADENWFQAHLKNFTAEAVGAAAPVDPLMLIEQARAVAAANPEESAARFADAWFPIAAFDPAFDGVRLGTLSREMGVLAARSPGGMGKFKALRASDASRFDPGSLEALFEHLTLDRVCGNIIDNLDFIDTSLNDVDSATLMPKADRIALELMLPRIHLGEPGAGLQEPAQWPRSLAAKITSVPDPRMKPDESARLKAFRAWLLRVECSRLHAALLLAGRDEAAMAVADVLLKSENSPLNRRSLVAAALASRQARPQHLTWLDGATDNQVSTDALHTHAGELLKAKKTDP